MTDFIFDLGLFDTQAEWEVWITSDVGKRLAVITRFVQTEVVLNTESFGAFSIVIPNIDYKEFILPDNRFEFYRKPVDGISNLIASGFIRDYVLSKTNQVELLKVSGLLDNSLAMRRIAPYYSGSPEVKKSGPADDVIRQIVRENFISPTDTNRIQPDLVVLPDNSRAPIINISFAYKPVSTVISNIRKKMLLDGWRLDPIFRPIIHNDGTLGFEFDVITREVEQESPRKILISDQIGNFEDPIVRILTSHEVTSVYSGGQGQEDDRIVINVKDESRINRSHWNLIEVFDDSRNQGVDVDSVTDSAEQRLQEGEPYINIEGKILDFPGTRFGVDYWIGSSIVVEAYNYVVDAYINGAKFEISASGLERIDLKINSKDMLLEPPIITVVQGL